jgi:hypothetical protein
MLNTSLLNADLTGADLILTKNLTPSQLCEAKSLKNI